MRGIGVGFIHDLTADHVIVPDGFAAADQLTFTPPPSAVCITPGHNPPTLARCSVRRSHEPRRRGGAPSCCRSAPRSNTAHTSRSTPTRSSPNGCWSAAHRVTAAVVPADCDRSIGRARRFRGNALDRHRGGGDDRESFAPPVPSSTGSSSSTPTAAISTPYVPPPSPASTKVDRSACGTPSRRRRRPCRLHRDVGHARHRPAAGPPAEPSPATPHRCARSSTTCAPAACAARPTACSVIDRRHAGLSKRSSPSGSTRSSPFWNQKHESARRDRHRAGRGSERPPSPPSSPTAGGRRRRPMLASPGDRLSDGLHGRPRRRRDGSRRERRR